MSNVELECVKDDSVFIRYVMKDSRYKDMLLPELLVARENIYRDVFSTMYDKALIQYRIMKIDGRI